MEKVFIFGRNDRSSCAGTSVHLAAEWVFSLVRNMHLYRGVINEKDILSCENGLVTFRYRDSKTKRYKTRTLSGAQFLRLVLQHVLPKGFRRARSYGFLHPNSKKLIKLIHLLFKYDPQKWQPKEKPRPQINCQCCGAVMIIVETRIERPKTRFMPRNRLEQTKGHAVF